MQLEPGNWKKSSFSQVTGHCVEVAAVAPEKIVAVRDSLNPQDAVLRFEPARWGSFLIGVRSGQFGQK